MGIKENLIKAKELIEKGWCQGAMAKDVAGNPIECNANDAVSFCVAGALHNIAPWNDVIAAKEVFNRINNIQSKYTGDWNDDPERTKEQVLEAFDKAIEACN